MDIVAENERRAHDKEYLEALHEGVKFHFETSVVEIHGGDMVRGVTVQNYTRQLSGRDSHFVPVANSQRQIECDRVVVAIGQKPFARIVATTTGLKTNEKGYVITNAEPYYGMTTRPGVFAAGDVVHEPQTVILAMREGRKVAEAMDAYLRTLHL